MVHILKKYANYIMGLHTNYVYDQNYLTKFISLVNRYQTHLHTAFIMLQVDVLTNDWKY